MYGISRRIRGATEWERHPTFKTADELEATLEAYLWASELWMESGQRTDAAIFDFDKPQEAKLVQ